MSKMNLKAQLIGVGAINTVYVYFERLPTIDYPFVIPIGLFPKNSAKKEWNNTRISIEVIGNLDLQVNVHAVKGTGWTFKLVHIINSTSSVDIFSVSGKTGDVPSDGLNVSIIRRSISI